MLEAKAPTCQKGGKLVPKLSMGHQTSVVKKKTQQMEPQVPITTCQSHKKPYYQHRPKEELAKAEEIIQSSWH
jgi:hypothetical protein